MVDAASTVQALAALRTAGWPPWWLARELGLAQLPQPGPRVRVRLRTAVLRVAADCAGLPVELTAEQRRELPELSCLRAAQRTEPCELAR